PAAESAAEGGSGGRAQLARCRAPGNCRLPIAGCRLSTSRGLKMQRDQGEQSPTGQAATGKRPSKITVGLIGGMGAGKSLVAEAFARRGARVISGDQLGHEALRQPPIKAQLVQRWGQEILDERGEVDRRRLGALVFADPAQRRALEALVFPWIE